MHAPRAPRADSRLRLLARLPAQIMDACSACFSPQLRDLFTPDSLAVALQQLVEVVPLPLLFMRTVIQTATVAPKLHGFILDLLSKLVLRQVWKTDAKLWQGVLRCAKQMVPRSFPVYLQLPAAQLKEALTQFPDLVAPLTLYAATPAVRSTVPGATLEVLGGMAAPAPMLE
jgi:symplekin